MARVTTPQWRRYDGQHTSAVCMSQWVNTLQFRSRYRPMHPYSALPYVTDFSFYHIKI